MSHLSLEMKPPSRQETQSTPRNKKSFELGSLSFVRCWNLGGVIKAELSEKCKETKRPVRFNLGVHCVPAGSVPMANEKWEMI
jgi:hypothetical protein